MQEIQKIGYSAKWYAIDIVMRWTIVISVFLLFSDASLHTIYTEPKYMYLWLLLVVLFEFLWVKRDAVDYGLLLNDNNIALRVPLFVPLFGGLKKFSVDVHQVERVEIIPSKKIRVFLKSQYAACHEDVRQTNNGEAYYTIGHLDKPIHEVKALIEQRIEQAKGR